MAIFKKTSTGVFSSSDKPNPIFNNKAGIFSTGGGIVVIGPSLDFSVATNSMYVGVF